MHPERFHCKKMECLLLETLFFFYLSPNLPVIVVHCNMKNRIVCACGPFKDNLTPPTPHHLTPFPSSCCQLFTLNSSFNWTADSLPCYFDKCWRNHCVLGKSISTFSFVFLFLMLPLLDDMDNLCCICWTKSFLDIKVGKPWSFCKISVNYSNFIA